MFFDREGRFRFGCGDEVFEAGPGTTAVLPRGVPHTCQCIGGARGRMLVSVTTGGFEKVFLDLETLPHADPVAVATLAARNGLRFCVPND